MIYRLTGKTSLRRKVKVFQLLLQAQSYTMYIVHCRRTTCPLNEFSSSIDSIFHLSVRCARYRTAAMLFPTNFLHKPFSTSHVRSLEWCQRAQDKSYQHDICSIYALSMRTVSNAYAYMFTVCVEMPLIGYWCELLAVSFKQGTRMRVSKKVDKSKYGSFSWHGVLNVSRVLENTSKIKKELDSWNKFLQNSRM